MLLHSGMSEAEKCRTAALEHGLSLFGALIFDFHRYVIWFCLLNGLNGQNMRMVIQNARFQEVFKKLTSFGGRN